MFYLDNHNSNFGSLESSYILQISTYPHNYLHTTNIYISTQFTPVEAILPLSLTLKTDMHQRKSQINKNLVRKFTMHVNFLL